MLILLTTLTTAWAQEYTGLDTHGFWLTPGDADPTDPIIGYRPDVHIPKAYGFQTAFEYVDSPLVVSEYASDGTLNQLNMLERVFALNVAAYGALNERLSAGISAPLYLSSTGDAAPEGAAFGDIRLSVPYELVLAPEGGFGLSVVPYADLPTGNADSFLGNAGLSGGGLVAAGYSTEKLAVTTNVGLGRQAPADFLNLEAGGYLFSLINTAYQLNAYHAIGVEGWIRPRLTPNVYPGAENPGEVMAYGRGRYDSGINWIVGAGMGVTRGASASNFRVFGGLGWTFGEQVSDRDGDGLADDEDACPDVPEVFNGYADQDGCADALASVLVTVRDEDGTLLPDATLMVGGEVRQLDENAQFTMQDQMPETILTTSGEHPLCISLTDEHPLAEGENTVNLDLPFKPAQVRVVTRANTGEVLDAKVQFNGPKEMEDATVGDDGEAVFELRPGDWEILVSAPAFGVESRTLSLAPGETSLIVIEVILEPAKVTVEGEQVVILEKVYFDYGLDTIMDQSLPLLEEVANTIKANPSLLRIEIGGHTDRQGSAEYNADLSQRRSESVMRFLVEKGVAPERLTAVGYGESNLIDQRNTNAAHARNRRVEFTILERAADAPEVQQAE